MYPASSLTKIRNGMITLPPKLREILEGVEDVCIIPAEGSLIIKPVGKPLEQLSSLAARVSSKKMSARGIQREIQAYRKTR